jgi:mannose-1-phosphate guanylyltransferase
VQAFKEKPDKATADRYVESGRYYWNSGMFVWRCDTVFNELGMHLPENHAGLKKIADAWNSPQQDATLKEVYPKLKKISVDYAIMEPASQHKGKAQVVVVEMPVKWLDVGSWPALAETLAVDDHDNAVAADTAVSSTPTATSLSAPTRSIWSPRSPVGHDRCPQQGRDDGPAPRARRSA